ncbi:MAG: FtsX-like permease family protein, partial [Cytophagales bacterium]|nr:FtsX-like permease family protein [Cytophagales bacterium]
APQSVQENMTYHLHPLLDIYLRSDFDYNIGPVGDIMKVRIFMAVALLIIVIASINYVNLATAQAVGRSKEVGMRKALGAGKKQVIAQFITESVLIASAALVVAVVLVVFLLPAFNQLTGKTLGAQQLLDLRFVLAGVLLVLVVGVVSGSYPAFYLSAVDPMRALKGAAAQTSRGALVLRKSLVVFQFAISVLLICSSLIIYNQWTYLKGKNLGLQTEQVVTLPVQSKKFVGNYHAFKTNLQGKAAVQWVSASNKSLTQRFFDFATTTRSATSNDTVLAFGAVDFDYFEALDIKLVEGRTFSKNIATDATQAIVINESARKFFGLDKALGQTLRIGSEKEAKTIVGVVRDFHFEDLYTEIVPMVFFVTDSYFNQVVIRLKGDDFPQAIQAIQSEWDKYGFTEPFSYSFLDESMAQVYQKEQQFLQIFAAFTALAILIACLGALGLISFMVIQRTREMGIRKVLGATTVDMVALLSRDFLLLVFIAFLIASPVAWYGMSAWLENYVYRTQIQWWAFGITGVVVLLVALLTISYQAVKAALVNPLKSLRSE